MEAINLGNMTFKEAQGVAGMWYLRSCKINAVYDSENETPQRKLKALKLLFKQLRYSTYLTNQIQDAILIRPLSESTDKIQINLNSLQG